MIEYTHYNVVVIGVMFFFFICWLIIYFFCYDGEIFHLCTHCTYTYSTCTYTWNVYVLRLIVFNIILQNIMLNINDCITNLIRLHHRSFILLDIYYTAAAVLAGIHS